MTESRWLDAETVAKMLRVRASQLPGMVGRGRIPRPSYHLGYRSPRWDRGLLDVRLRDATLVQEGAAEERFHATVDADEPMTEPVHEPPAAPDSGKS